jgi:RHS repeat-associated protein
MFHPNSMSSGDDASAYDALNRLTYYNTGALSASGNNGSVLDTIGGSSSGTASISYDGIGNVASNGTGSYGYNGQNQIASGETTAYDNNGNMTLEAGVSYTYDAWNRLLTVSLSSFAGTDTYQYDAQGRRIYQSSIASERYFDSAGQVIEEHFSGSLVAQYVWGLDYVNDMVLRDDDYFGSHSDLGITGSGLGERLYTEHDAEWDISSLTDDTGTLAQWNFYEDPNGTFIIQGTPHFMFYGFQGGRQDDPDGLINFGARDFDPNGPSGHWMEEEPSGAAYVDGANLYQAFDDNPTSCVDPSGRKPNTAAVVAGSRVYGPWVFSTETPGAWSVDSGEGSQKVSEVNVRAWFTRKFRDLYQCCDVLDNGYWRWGSVGIELGHKDSQVSETDGSVLVYGVGGGYPKIPTVFPGVSIPLPIPIPALKAGSTPPMWQGWKRAGSPNSDGILLESKPGSLQLVSPVTCSCAPIRKPGPPPPF